MTRDYLRSVNLHLAGLRRLLGPREASIMEHVWGKKDVSVRQVHRTLFETEDVAYTTVMTIMDRLWKKRILTRRKDGKAYLYTPTESRESFVTRCVGQIFEAFLPDLGEAGLSTFIDSMAREDPGLLDELERLLRERKDGS